MKKKQIKTEIHKFADGELHIFQDNGAKNWTAKFYPKKKYKSKNIQSTNIEIAREIAYSWYLNLTKVHKDGNPIMAKVRSHTITEMHKYLDDKLHIYKRSYSVYWQARFFAEGKYKNKSLKETKFELAKKIAHDWYFELQNKQKIGTPIHGKKFKDVLPSFFDYQKVLVSGGEMEKDNADKYEVRLKGKGIQYFHNYYLQDINLQSLNKFKTHRITNDEVKHTTIKHDFVAINQVLKYCILQGHITTLPEAPKKSKKDKPNPRHYFELEEWKELLKVSKERIANARGTRNKREREQLHDFMLMMVHTGCRVEETLKITFGDCKVHKKKNGTKELRFTIKGKTGVRPVRGMIGAVSAYERICARFPKHKKTDCLFPQRHTDGLNALLKATNLKIDKYGNKRNAKSFRPTFIMYRLIAGQPIKSIATNCGTSSEIIDKYYAKFIDVNMLDDSFTDLPE
jgi:integrase